MFEAAVRPGLFRLGGGDAEAAHEWTLRRLESLTRRPAVLAALRLRYAVAAPREVFGLRFANPVGLAAGMDKDGVALAAWPALGFGFVELGTVTRHPQPGNERPRLFRLMHSEAIVNRMGFNNAGARALANRLAAGPRPVGPGRLPVPVGISLGKSARTPLAEAVADYLASLAELHPHGDYFAINVSSPNTPGLRSLQQRDDLSDLLAQLRTRVRELAGDAPSKPLLVKIAPDLTLGAIAEALDVCVKHEIAGVIATNTTLARSGVDPRDAALAAEPGGLSGRPLAARAREVVAFIRQETGGRLPIVGVGGVLDPDDALRLFDAGASLVQLYTGLVYRGPALVRRINRLVGDRAGHLRQDGRLRQDEKG